MNGVLEAMLRRPGESLERKREFGIRVVKDLQFVGPAFLVIRDHLFAENRTDELLPVSRTRG